MSPQTPEVSIEELKEKCAVARDGLRSLPPVTNGRDAAAISLVERLCDEHGARYNGDSHFKFYQFYFCDIATFSLVDAERALRNWVRAAEKRIRQAEDAPELALTREDEA